MRSRTWFGTGLSAVVAIAPFGYLKRLTNEWFVLNEGDFARKPGMVGGAE